MDNLTHSLTGAIVAESVLRFAPARSRPERRGALHLASILANNLPDLDFLYSWITPGKLGYLLHHRGHTHTLPVAFALAALVALGFRAWLARRAPPAAERRTTDGVWIAFVSALGVLLHLAMDFGNSYGVHPFWPFHDGWFYGDAVFIVEPLAWVGFGTTLCFLVRTRWMRVITGLVATAGLAFVWLLPVPWPGAAFVTATALAVAWIGWRGVDPKRRLTIALLAAAVFTLGQFGAGAAVERHVSKTLAAEPSLAKLDLVRSPIPASPWCWDVTLVARERRAERDDYLLRTGRVTLLPALFPASACPKLRETSTATLVASTAPDALGLDWNDEFRFPMTELRALAEDCWFRAFLRFARTPFYEPERRLAGDLRYDRDAEEDFAELVLPDPRTCPKWVPPWIPPRADVFFDEASR